LGLGWVALQSKLTAGCYVLVFGVAFQSRVSIDRPNADSLVVFLLAGLSVWFAASDVLGRASGAVSGNPNFVKQMVFPVEVLPARLIGPALVTQCFVTLVMIGYALFLGHPFTWTWLLWPAAVAMEIAIVLGLAYFVAGVGVFFRDIRDLVSLYLTIGLFLSPVLYQLDSVPRMLAYAAYANPLTPLVLVMQDITIHGAVTQTWAWIAAPLLGLAALHLGYRTFRNLRPMMGDVL
jgi:lipopolysaccharide transport system permease protein